MITTISVFHTLNSYSCIINVFSLSLVCDERKIWSFLLRQYKLLKLQKFKLLHRTSSADANIDDTSVLRKNKTKQRLSYNYVSVWIKRSRGKCSSSEAFWWCAAFLMKWRSIMVSLCAIFANTENQKRLVTQKCTCQRKEKWGGKTPLGSIFVTATFPRSATRNTNFANFATVWLCNVFTQCV